MCYFSSTGFSGGPVGKSRTASQSGVTHSTGLSVVWSMGEGEGGRLQGTLAVSRGEGRVPTAGQDHIEVSGERSLVSAGEREIRLERRIGHGQYCVIALYPLLNELNVNLK